MRINELSFRYGKEAVAKHSEVLASIFAAIVNAQEAQLKRPTVSIERHLRRELLAENWMRPEEDTSFLNKRIALHTEFSQYEFVYRDLLQLLIAYNAGQIDAGVIITNTVIGSRRVRHKLIESNFERVRGDLDWLRPAFPFPVWLIGLK